MTDVVPVLRAVVFISLLASAAVTDIKSRTISYSVCAAVAAVGLIDFSPIQLLGTGLAIPFFIASMKDRGGMGDVFLIAASCFTLGPTKGADGLVLALVCFALFWLAATIVRKLGGKTDKPASYPLAPFLAVGFTTAYFTGGFILLWVFLRIGQLLASFASSWRL